MTRASSGKKEHQQQINERTRNEEQEKRLKQEYLPTYPAHMASRTHHTHTRARTPAHTHVDTAVDVEA